MKFKLKLNQLPLLEDKQGA